MRIVRELKEVAMAAGSITQESRITTVTCKKIDLPAKTTTSHHMDIISMANATNLTICSLQEVEVVIGVAVQIMDSTAMVLTDTTRIMTIKIVILHLLAGTMTLKWAASSEAETTGIKASQDTTTRDQ